MNTEHYTEAFIHEMLAAFFTTLDKYEDNHINPAIHAKIIIMMNEMSTFLPKRYESVDLDFLQEIGSKLNTIVEKYNEQCINPQLLMKLVTFIYQLSEISLDVTNSVTSSVSSEEKE